MDEAAQKLAELEAKVKALEDRMSNWENMQIAPESGGGYVSMRGDKPIIRINSLTPEGQQLAG